MLSSLPEAAERCRRWKPADFVSKWFSPKKLRSIVANGSPVPPSPPPAPPHHRRPPPRPFLRLRRARLIRPHRLRPRQAAGLRLPPYRRQALHARRGAPHVPPVRRELLLLQVRPVRRGAVVAGWRDGGVAGWRGGRAGGCVVVVWTGCYLRRPVCVVLGTRLRLADEARRLESTFRVTA